MAAFGLLLFVAFLIHKFPKGMAALLLLSAVAAALSGLYAWGFTQSLSPAQLACIQVGSGEIFNGSDRKIGRLEVNVQHAVDLCGHYSLPHRVSIDVPYGVEPGCSVSAEQYGLTPSNEGWGPYDHVQLVSATPRW